MSDPVWKCGWCEYDMAPEGVPAGQVKVTTLHWDATQAEPNADPEEDDYSARQYGTVSTADQNRVYTLPALQNVPNHVMVGWVQDALGEEEVDRIEAALQANIDLQVTPTSGGLTPGE